MSSSTATTKRKGDHVKRVGIVFSGGPAPAANAVISAAAISFIDDDREVIGFFHGYSNLAEYHPVTHRLLPDEHYRIFQERDITGLRNTRGIVIGTARTNPGKAIEKPADLDDPIKTAALRNVYNALVDLGINALISIGGDDTLKTANFLYEYQKRLPAGARRVQVVHVPKTIDNDYRGIDFTFGFFTAVDVMAKELQNLRADAIATSSYFIVETMGRKAGWLCYGVGIAGEANLVLAGEDIDAFTQAEWRPSARLSAMLGLRWDGTAFLTAPASNALVEQVLGERTDRKPSDWSKIQPRAQLVWDVTGAERDVVRLGGGRFSAQAPYYVQHNQILNDGNRIADITLTGANIPVPNYASYRADPATNPGLPAGAPRPAPYVNLVSPDFRTPSVWKGSASYRRRVGDRLALTGTLLYTRTTDDYMYADRNLRTTPAFTLSNEENRAVFVPAATIDAQGHTLNANALTSPLLGRVLELVNTGEARQHTEIAEAQAVLPLGATVNASYTHSVARDNTTFGCCLARTSTTFTAIQSDPRDLSGSWGPSDTDFRHKFVVAGSIPVGWGVLLGGRYVGASGLPFSAVVNGDINGDEATSNDLAFVFDPNDPSTPSAIAASMRKGLDNPRNVARGYLRDNLGQIASRNGATAPWSERIDARLSKTFNTTRGQAAEIGIDVFNVANMLNHNWGAQYTLPVGISNQNPVVQRIPLLNVVGFNQTTRQYTYTINENFGVLQKSGNPYQIQLAARYRF